MKSQMLGIVLLGVALLAGPAHANVINFDNLGNNVTVTNQYADVVFSAGTCGFYQGELIDCNPDPQNLAYLGITQVIIHNNVDPAGTAYDDFSFTPQLDTASVPEPSTLLLTGLCGIFWAGRRFLARKSM
jgi:PEP-CTERM motif